MSAREVAERAARRVLGALRRGPRTIVFTDPDVNFGNFCFLWLHAYTRQQAGEDVVVSTTPRMRPWLPLLPYVRDRLVVDPAEIRFLDRRDLRQFQGWGSDYLPPQIPPFVTDVLIDSPIGLTPAVEEPGRVVVNVRRGDFFGPRYAPRYSYDVVAYLREALARSVALGGPVTWAHVVSDDLDWCRDRLPAVFADRRITYESDDRTPTSDFRAIAGARRLILTTSTFGYWAAHVSNQLHPDSHEQVVVPWFHDRTIWGGECYMLNPSWTVVRSLPGGWGPDLPAAT